VVHLDGFIGGPDRDRTDDLFHAISATSRNSLKLHDTNRAVTVPNAHIFPVIGPLMDPHPIGVDCHPGSPRGTGIFSAKFRFARHPTRIGFGDSTNWRDLSQSACIYNGSPTRRTKPSKRRSERSGSTQGSILRYVSPLSCAARDFSSHANASSFSPSPA
jgi:hypothetical protein